MRLSETQLPTREHTWAGPRPSHTDVADVKPDLRVGPKQLEYGLSQKLLPVLEYVLLAGQPCLAPVGEEALSLTET